MSHLSFYLFVLVIIFSSSLYSQKKWDGGGTDGQWNSALNWSDDAVPDSLTDIVLDNSIVHSSYKVNLPSGSISVTVKSIRIVPSAGNNIELILPAGNTIVPALIIRGPGYGLDIGSGGIFRNASGAPSGTPVDIADSIRIQNGGRYIHNTERAHAANVQVLSRTPGTEQGIMEFDVPDLSSTISLSGRTYGKLLLKATSVTGGKLKYTAAGTNGARIRSDFEIGKGVSLGLNFADTISVDGDFIEDGTVDLGNTARNTVLAIKGNVMQSDSGIITESGTGIQQILLNGNTSQNLKMKGTVSNDVGLAINSSSEVSLRSALILPYQLSLLNGVINTSEENLLILNVNCSVHADTLLGKSFVNGPLRKLGMSNSNFVFPVGQHSNMRWLELKNTTGNFTVEYIQDNPYKLGSSTGTGLNHISHQEYWNVSGTGMIGNLTTILSFTDPVSGGVTDLTDLRVARLINGVWENQGNTAVGGTAGSSGWVSSFAAGGFSAGNNYFALASALGQENPLPLSKILLRLDRSGEIGTFRWKLISDEKVDVFELQGSDGNNDFKTIKFFPANKNINVFDYDYRFTDPLIKCFRIVAKGEKGTEICFSNMIEFKALHADKYSVVGKNVSNTSLLLTLSVPQPGIIKFIMLNSMGARVKEFQQNVLQESSEINIDISNLAAGLYFLMGRTARHEAILFRFIKW